MTLASISYGPKLGLINNAAIGEVYYDQFRPFLRGMDALVQASVLARSSIVPTTPNDGDAYIVLTGANGAWAGQTNNIAVYSTQITSAGSNNLTPGWEFYTPQSGWSVYSIADGLFYHYIASSVSPPIGGGWVSSLATSSVAGTVVPDNTSITINSSGVISSVSSAPPTATTTTLGVVKPDNTSITINGSGVISSVPTPTATTTTLGVVKPDNTSITISGGVLSLTYTGAAGSGAGWGGPPGTGSAGGLFVQAMEGGTSLTFSQPVAVGNTLIVIVGYFTNGTFTGVSDSLGNTFTAVPYASGVYYISNHIAVGGIDTITLTGIVGTPTASVVALEYTGLPTGSGASIVNAGTFVSGSSLGPTTLTATQSLVVLTNVNSVYGYAPTVAGATQRYGAPGGVVDTTWAADMLVNAGSFAVTIVYSPPGTPLNSSGFIAIGL